MNKERISRACHATAGGLMKTGLVGTTAAVLMMQAAPAGAQQTELDALRAQIAELQARLERLETTSTTITEANKTNPPATARLPITVQGLLQVNTRNLFNQKGPGGVTPDTFQLRRGELRVTGTILDRPTGKTLPRLTGTIMIDPAKNTAATSTSTVTAPAAGAPPGTQPTVTTTTTLNQANNPLQEMMLSYALRESAATNYTIVDVGQYKIPFGYEGDLVSSSAIPTVDRALMFLARDPFGGGNGDIRDTGVRLRGLMGRFDYQLMAANGLGERQNALASGDPKAIIGRLIYSPAGIGGLQLGISGARGNQRGIPGATNRVDRNLYNAFVNYTQDKWFARAEYLTGKNQLIAAAPGVVRDIRSYYALLGYKLTPKLEGVLRLDHFDFDRDLRPTGANSNDTEVNEAVLGLNYYLRGNNAKIQANLVRRRGGAGLIAGNAFGGNATGFGKSSTQLRTNFQVSF